MTPVDELVLSKLRLKNYDFTNKEYLYLVNLVNLDVTRKYGTFM